MNENSHYLTLAAAYARGALGRPDLDDVGALAAAAGAGLRLHRFKRTAGLPRVRRVLGVLRRGARRGVRRGWRGPRRRLAAMST